MSPPRPQHSLTLEEDVSQVTAAGVRRPRGARKEEAFYKSPGLCYHWRAALEQMSHPHVSQALGQEPSAPHRRRAGPRDAQVSGRPAGRGLRSGGGDDHVQVAFLGAE